MRYGWCFILFVLVVQATYTHAALSSKKAEFDDLGVKPVAFFPLTEDYGFDSYESRGKYSGEIIDGLTGKRVDNKDGVTWAKDRDNTFDSAALTCYEDYQGLVRLSNVPYGNKGPFSINIWIKQAPLREKNHTNFEYIFSHASVDINNGSFFPFASNQIHLFLPEVSHPAHGVIRAIVKDSSDDYTGLLSQTFLDSDGRYMDNDARNIPGHIDFEDGEWHMVTVTTRTNSTNVVKDDSTLHKGYKLYVDGVHAGDAPPSILWDALEANATGIPGLDVDGGDPFKISGPIHLCGRIDGDANRHFGGSLAHLSLWDMALSPEQVSNMFASVKGEEALKERCMQRSRSGWQESNGDPCPFLDLQSANAGNRSVSDPHPKVSDIIDVIGRDNERSTQKSTLYPDVKKEKSSSDTHPKVSKLVDLLEDEDDDEDLLEEVEEAQEEEKAQKLLQKLKMGDEQRSSTKFTTEGAACSLASGPSSCAYGLLCLPSFILDRLDKPSNASGVIQDKQDKSVGKCVKPPVGGLFPADPAVGAPLPIAYFPLTGGNVDSWPTGKYKGNYRGVKWIPDMLFENVLDCREVEGNYVRLDNVNYGASGEFAVSFWMRSMDNMASRDGGFEYIYSHGSKPDSRSAFNPFAPNQVNIYLPESSHPAHGVVRTIVKDSESQYKGLLSHTFFDSDGQFMDNSPRDTIGHVDIGDGDWHMVTLTTKKSKEPGYSVYVDGTLGGSFPPPQLENFLANLNQTGRDTPPVDFSVDGGNPLKIDGDIYLCGRSDLAKGRHFDGQLSQLRIYNESLTPEMVAAMYRAVKGHSVILDSLMNLASSIRALQPNISMGMPHPLLSIQKYRQNQSDTTSEGCMIDVEKVGLVSPKGCDENGLLCAAVSNEGRGVCVAAPDGGIYAPDPSVKIPIPKAYFPLTGGNVQSWPEEKFKGKNHGALFVDDEYFGKVMQCKENANDYVELDNIDYGKNGQFAVNLWMRHNGSTGTAFEFLVSHGNDNDGEESGPWSPNEMQIYVPEIAHPAHGVIRTIVKDSNDKYEGPQSRTFLDSDGGFMNNQPRNIPGHANLDDGKWHMVTLTTQQEGKGYSVYVDGLIGGTAPPAFMQTLSTNMNLPVDGGDPIMPSGSIYLCGRNDLHPERHYGGRMAHLSFFETSLNPEQIMALYTAGAGETAALQKTLGLVLSQIPSDSLLNNEDSTSSDSKRAKVGEVCFMEPPTNNLEQMIYSSALQEKKCVKGAICSPKANNDRAGYHGVCVATPAGDFMPEMQTHDANVPVPYAFFPLTGNRLSTWPSPVFNGTDYGVKWTDDSIFGKSLECTKDSYVKLDSVPFASSGPFTVNFWMKNSDSGGQSFEYIFSQAHDDSMGFSPFFPNQIHVYLPEINHPAHGVVRTIVKDDNDVYEGLQSETFLDSDGELVNNMARDTPGHISIDDGEWHMVTVTSRPDKGKGYAVFLDGVLGAANFLDMKSPSENRAPNGMPYHIDGGDEMNLGGHIFLCGRSDLHPERHFKGKLSHLSLFDSALAPDDVAAMYIAVKGEESFRERLVELVKARQPERQQPEGVEISNVEPVPPSSPDTITESTAPVCPSDVKRCTDGRWVSRTGPKCEFVCPEKSETRVVDSSIPITSNTQREREQNPSRNTVDSSNSYKSGMDKSEQKPKVNEKKSMAVAGVVGAAIGIAFMLVVAAMVVVGCYFKKKNGMNKSSMLALPTRSPAVSRNPSNVCISPDMSFKDDIEAHVNPMKKDQEVLDDGSSSKHSGASSGGLMEQMKNFSAKSKKSKMSKYGELDE